MNTDKDIAENENGWLAQELIPAMSTNSGMGRRALRELLVRFRCIIALVLVAAIVAVFTYWSLLSNPRYTNEDRIVATDGTVTYLSQRYGDCNNKENISALRRHTLARIYHCVYYNGLLYNFSRSGHVFATEPSEAGAPFDVVRAWSWSGEPHQFPYYNFSDTSHRARP